MEPLKRFLYPRPVCTGNALFVATSLAVACILSAQMAAAKDHVGEYATEDGYLAQALENAADHDALGYAYRLRVHVLAEGEEVTLTTRFDPRLPVGERWQTLESDSSDGESKIQFGDDDDPNGGLPDYAELSRGLKFDRAVLASESDSEAVYEYDGGLSAFLEDDMVEFAEHLRTRIVVAKSNTAEPYISKLIMHAPEPFRQAVVARFGRLDVIVAFERDIDLNHILPRTFDLNLEGSVMFVDFEAKTNIRYDEFQYVGGPAEIDGNSRQN